MHDNMADVGDDDPERHDVRQLLEADVPLGHLLPDRKGVLLAADDLGLEPVVGEVQLKYQANSIDGGGQPPCSCSWLNRRRVIDA